MKHTGFNLEVIRCQIYQVRYGCNVSNPNKTGSGIRVVNQSFKSNAEWRIMILIILRIMMSMKCKYAIKP